MVFMYLVNFEKGQYRFNKMHFRMQLKIRAHHNIIGKTHAWKVE